MKTIDKVRQAARDSYAWPGGYQLLILMADGESICPQCAHDNWRQVAHNTKANLSDWPDKQWRAEDVYINWEGSPITCAHCGKEYHSEYGEVK